MLHGTAARTIRRAPHVIRHVLCSAPTATQRKVSSPCMKKNRSFRLTSPAFLSTASLIGSPEITLSDTATSGTGLDEEGRIGGNNDDDEGRIQLQQRIIREACRMKTPISDYGFTRQAMRDTAHKLQMSEATAGVFQSEFEVAAAFMRECEQQIMEELHKTDTSTQSTKDIVRAAVRMRIEMIRPYREHWPEAMAHGLLPQNAPEMAKLLASLSDTIWRLTNDHAHDVDWYAKRAWLATVYATTELYYVTDRSNESEDTWRFLENRLEQAETLVNIPDTIANTVKIFGPMAAAFVTEIATKAFGGCHVQKVYNTDEPNNHVVNEENVYSARV